MIKIVKWLAIIVLLPLALCLLLWSSAPHWVPLVANHFLPAEQRLSLDSIEWRNGQLSIPSLKLTHGDCVIADGKQLNLGLSDRIWQFSLHELTLDPGCLPTSSTVTQSEPLSFAELQSTLPEFRLIITRLVLQQWQEYAGSLLLINQQSQQQLEYQNPYLNGRITLQDQQLHLQEVVWQSFDNRHRLQLTGKMSVAEQLDQLPLSGNINGELFTTETELASPLSLAFSWQQNRGDLIVSVPDNDTPLIHFPWTITQQKLSIEQGSWSWPYATQPLSGLLSMQLSEWRKGLSEMTLDSRLNLFTNGHHGKGNVVVSIGPGKLSASHNNLPIQLTGQANLETFSLTASIPGAIEGELLDPQIALKPGALLRAYGVFSPTIRLNEVRFPLAGIKIKSSGISGRLQAIMDVTESYWGRFDLHLDGEAKEFWPDQGDWNWRYWGKGYLPLFDARWDVAGKGGWHDSLIAITQLSTGLDKIHYGKTQVNAPRITAKAPLQWQRDPSRPSLTGNFQLVSNRIDLAGKGYLPPTTVNLTINGRDPTDFLWQSDLSAKKIGPIKFSGRWDGVRLRGQGWWEEQPLTVFQPLLPPDLEWEFRDGTLRAQVAFSAALDQKPQLGGHWVVKKGSMWLKEGEVKGLDFIMSFRFKDLRWQLGVNSPIVLRVQLLDNLFQFTDITADLQGYYPYDEQHPLRLTDVSVNLLRGKVLLPELRLPQREPARLRLEEIELSELFTVLQPKQFAMSGKVYGELPLYINDPDWLIRDGWITNENYLTLRVDKDMADAIANNNMAVGAVTDWLRYMEINRSQAKLELDNLGILHMKSEIHGVNSQKNAKRSIVLNYQHTENLFQLWRSLSFGSNLQEWLQQQLSSPGEMTNE